MNSNRGNKMEYNGSMRIVQIIFWIASGIVIIGGVFLMLPSLIFPFFALISPKIPEPEITYGEFPFRIEYELDGQLNIIEDTVIAEFNGCEFSAGSMKRERRWRSRLASGREDLPFGDDLGIYFSRGSAQYYMGENVQSMSLKPHIALRNLEEGFKREVDFILGESGYIRTVLNFGEAQEVLTQYGITLINWEISEPIVNNFGD